MRISFSCPFWYLLPIESSAEAPLDIRPCLLPFIVKYMILAILYPYGVF